MITERHVLLTHELSRQLVFLRKAIRLLSESHRKCSARGIQSDYSEDDLEKFESLTSRFSRASDLLVQKIFGLLDALESEDRGSVIDRINRAEKRGIVQSAATFREMREVRNRIAHEYADENLSELFQKVLHFTPALIETLPSLEDYLKNKIPGA